jgi:hypothetical protein
MNVVVTPPRNNNTDTDNNNHTSVSPVAPGAPTRNIDIASYKPNRTNNNNNNTSSHRKLEDALKDIEVENSDDV